MLPAVKARIRNSASRNMGSGTRVSMMPKPTRRTTPPTDQTPMTSGLVQPMAWPP